MLRLITGSTARTVRLCLLSTVTALALGCDQADSPLEPPAVEDGAAVPAEAVPTRAEMAALVGGPRHWADGYAWADRPATASYAGNPYTSHNRSGGPVTVTKPAGTTGQYVVTFSGLSRFLGNRSTVHVSSDRIEGYPEDTYCKPVGAYLVSDRIEVRCFRASTRAAANAGFRVMVTRNYADLAFAYAHKPSGSSYAASTQGSWNPAGGSRVNRRGVGQYEVVFGGLGSELPPNVGGHVQVNAVGTGTAHCKVENWAGGTNLSINVRCLTPAGQLVDSKFTVLFLAPTDRLAYAWANLPYEAMYSPAPTYSSNATGGPITINRTAQGTYEILWADMYKVLIESGTVQTTAFGQDNTQCIVATAGITNPGRAHVRCFGSTGLPVDAQFTVLVGS